MAKDHGPSVKDDKQYEGLRKKGMSKSRGRCHRQYARGLQEGRQELLQRRQQSEQQVQRQRQRRQPRPEAGRRA